MVFPFFALSRKGLNVKDETRYEDKLERDGKRIEVLWRVTRNTAYRYPGPFDRKVHKAIEELIDELPLPIENPIPFSIYDLCKRIGISARGGKNYREIKEALKTVVATTIESKGTLYLKDRKRWVDDVFHLYERVVFRGEQLPNGEVADTNYLYLGSWYLDNINTRYVKPLDYTYYKSLNSTIAQRLYELFSVKFYRLFLEKFPCLNYRYSTLCQLLPITRQRHLSLAKQQLSPSHKELEDTSFLSKVEWKETSEERDWVLEYYPGARAEQEVERYRSKDSAFLEDERQRALPFTQTSDDIELQGLVEAMIEILGDEESRGFYIKVARLVSSNVIYRYLSEVKDDWLRGKVRKSKGALFTDKIKRYCRERGIDLGLKSSS